jgi:Zn finger protein HypA/HybF involved in hydrogenase expression
MHEMGIAQSVMEIVEKQLATHPGAQARTVGLRIGAYAGIDDSSLTFCFDCLKADTSLRDAALQIEHAERDELDVMFVEMEVP